MGNEMYRLYRVGKNMSQMYVPAWEMCFTWQPVILFKPAKQGMAGFLFTLLNLEQPGITRVLKAF